MIGRIVVAGALLAMLGACSVQTRTIAGEDECASYGLSVGSSEYRKCRDREGRAGKG